jgi:hypothetical protein
MAELYSSITTSQRGEGHRSVSQVTSTEKSNSNTSEAGSTTTEVSDQQSSLTTETPGKVVTVSEDKKPVTVRSESRPETKSVQVELPASITRTQKASESKKIVQDDYGIKVTFKINIRDLMN